MLECVPAVAHAVSQLEVRDASLEVGGLWAEDEAAGSELALVPCWPTVRHPELERRPFDGALVPTVLRTKW